MNRTITTVVELQALPFPSTVTLTGDSDWHKRRDGRWLSDDGDVLTSRDLALISRHAGAPLTVAARSTSAPAPSVVLEAAVQCPGMFVGWSAFGASYPDTVCSTSLAWDLGTSPSSPTLCDADDDHRPKDIPCPACDPQRFDEYAGLGAHLAVYEFCDLAPAQVAAVEEVALALCLAQESVEHMQQADDGPCSRCLTWARAALAAALPVPDRPPSATREEVARSISVDALAALVTGHGGSFETGLWRVELAFPLSVPVSVGSWRQDLLDAITPKEDR